MEELKSGFDAISGRLKTIYPDQEGLYYGTMMPYFLGGKDPLDGVEVYLSSQSEPHWHYITYGFSDLYGQDEEEETEPEEGSRQERKSGYGFELTFRLKKTGDEPPVWPVNLLQNLARYVFSSGNVFDSGHHIDCNGPVALETDTKLTALGFVTDAQLGEMETQRGHVKFIQAAAITHDEMEGMMCWGGELFLKELEKKIPFCITDLSRDSLMKDEEFHEIWKQGVERDGSSTSVLYMEEFQCTQEDGWMQIKLGAGHISTFVTIITARVGKKRTLYVETKNGVCGFLPGEKSGFGMEEDFVSVLLTEESVCEIGEVLKPHTGEYLCRTIPLKFIVVPTEIKDQNGNVLEVIE